MQDMDKTKKCCVVQSTVLQQQKIMLNKLPSTPTNYYIKILCKEKDLGIVNWIKLAQIQ